MSFEIDDFLHIREKYDDDWWIGRVVSLDPNLHFIPSPVKIEKIRNGKRSRKSGRIIECSISEKEGKKEWIYHNWSKWHGPSDIVQVPGSK